MLEVRNLQLVRAVAEEGSVTRAGTRLHLSQSALSHQLRDVEERLGCRLFERIGKRMVITASGRRLLETARAVLGELDRAEEDIRREAARPRGLLRLTTQCNTVYHWLPSRLKVFQGSFPDVELQVVAGATDDPVPSLVSGGIDLAIVHRPVKEARLLVRPLFRDEMVVVMAPTHRLARSPFVAPEDLGAEHLIVYSIPREANLVFRDVLIPAGVSPARVTHIQLTEAIVEMVKAGLGLSVLARWAVAPEVERGEVVARPLTRRGRYRQWSAAYRKKPTAPDYLLGFVDVLLRHPLPIGRTSRERKRIAEVVVHPGGARGVRLDRERA